MTKEELEEYASCVRTSLFASIACGMWAFLYAREHMWVLAALIGMFAVSLVEDYLNELDNLRELERYYG